MCLNIKLQTCARDAQTYPHNTIIADILFRYAKCGLIKEHCVYVLYYKIYVRVTRNSKKKLRMTHANEKLRHKEKNNHFAKQLR